MCGFLLHCLTYCPLDGSVGHIQEKLKRARGRPGGVVAQTKDADYFIQGRTFGGKRCLNWLKRQWSTRFQFHMQGPPRQSCIFSTFITYLRPELVKIPHSWLRHWWVFPLAPQRWRNQPCVDVFRVGIVWEEKTNNSEGTYSLWYFISCQVYRSLTLACSVDYLWLCPFSPIQ